MGTDGLDGYTRSLHLPRRTTEHIGGYRVHAQAFISGASYAQSVAQLEVMNPADESCCAVLDDNSETAVAAAVADAKAVFESGVWSLATHGARSTVLRAIAESIRANAADLAALDTLCAGLPYHRSTLRHVAGAACWFDYYADFLTTQSDTAHFGTCGRTTLITCEPRGVVGLYAPWNMPMGIAAIKLAAALAAGNSCVIKPSEQTPLSMLKLAQLMIDAGLPPGCVNVINGRGVGAGAALAAHRDVAAISFTGGGAAGAQIAQVASARFAPVTMELGGKSPTLVFADADYDAALDGALLSAFSNSGQACLAGSRVLVARTVADRFIADFVARTEAITLAEPMSEACEMGPMSSQRHLAHVETLTQKALDQGAQLLCGADRPVGFDKGYYFRPAVLQVDDPANTAFQTEVFGPVATIMTFDTPEEALALAQDSAYGLAAYVWTGSISRAMELSKTLKAGSVLINTAFQRELNAPFGGYKASGIGREGGPGSYAFYTQEKTILISDDPAKSPKLGVPS